ncbi:MAG: 2-amino-4-hydroxy-6-hydroxymethyldihydropteridine diphosphokinase [Ignavibacteriaceae bacterium]
MKAVPENIVYIGLGSNKGDRLSYLKNSIAALNEIDSLKILKVSSVYETKPFGMEDQNNFFNAAVKLTTYLDPKSLLKVIKQVEDKLGRSESKKWGPREIDIDILLFNDLIFSDEFISLPHKGIIYRDFVLQPLCELEPGLVHPVLNLKLTEILAEIEEKYIINKIPEIPDLSGQIN